MVRRWKLAAQRVHKRPIVDRLARAFFVARFCGRLHRLAGVRFWTGIERALDGRDPNAEFTRERRLADLARARALKVAFCDAHDWTTEPSAASARSSQPLLRALRDQVAFELSDASENGQHHRAHSIIARDSFSHEIEARAPFAELLHRSENVERTATETIQARSGNRSKLAKLRISSQASPLWTVNAPRAASTFAIDRDDHPTASLDSSAQLAPLLHQSLVASADAKVNGAPNLRSDHAAILTRLGNVGAVRALRFSGCRFPAHGAGLGVGLVLVLFSRLCPLLEGSATNL
jgi:hypothetical protein